MQVSGRLVRRFGQLGMHWLAVGVRIHRRAAVVAVLHRHPVVEHQRVGQAALAQHALDLADGVGFLVLGTEPRSYDGRYWGFLDQSAVIGTVKPLF